VQLYAGAFFPGIMLASLYVGYVIVLAKLKPALMPPLPESEQRVPLPDFAGRLASRTRNAFAGLLSGLGAPGVPKRRVLSHLVVTALPALVVVGALAFTYQAATTPKAQDAGAGLVEMGGESSTAASESESSTGLVGALSEPEEEKQGEAEPLGGPAAEEPKPEEKTSAAPPAPGPAKAAAASSDAERLAAPTWFWVALAVCVAILAVLYLLWTWERLEVFKMLLASFFPLALLIIAVLGSIVFGFATPTEAAAVGAFGGFLLAVAYRYIEHWRAARARNRGAGNAVWTTAREMGVIVKDSSFLTAKTSAMVCWLFVGSSIFSAAFALLGGQEVVEKWVLSLDLSPVQFMIMAQFIIFILGWPLEWTEIIVIFMPIFIPLLAHFNIDPLFFGLLVALNLQTAFLSPPVAMAAFYLKGVSPPHVTLNQIFGGMLPFMGIQVVALALLYIWPGIGLWLPNVLYGR
jgi:TRAP-type mannitol/chloroaromatic compound transport system permease large subunit